MAQHLPMIVSGKVSIDRVDGMFINGFLWHVLSNARRFLEKCEIYPANQSLSNSLQTELLDAYSVTSPSVSGGDELPEPSNEVIGFHNARFTWSASSNHKSGSVIPRRNFTLRAEGGIFFKRGVLNLVVGPTGSGKTSLLLALLGEMHFTPNGVDTWYYLPRDKGIAYCPQEAWLLNDTIRVSAQVDTRGTMYTPFHRTGKHTF